MQFLFTASVPTVTTADPAGTTVERLKIMKLALIIIGGIAIAGLIPGIVFAVVHEIVKEQKKEQEKPTAKQPPSEQ